MFLLLEKEQFIDPVELLEIRSELEANILKDLAPRPWALLPYRPGSYHGYSVDSIRYMWFQLSQILSTSRTSRNVHKDISPMHFQNISFISGATHIMEVPQQAGRSPEFSKVERWWTYSWAPPKISKSGAMQGITLAYSQKWVNRETTASNKIQYNLILSACCREISLPWFTRTFDTPIDTTADAASDSRPHANFLV